MSIRMQGTSFEDLLRELQHIWDEMGESEAERDQMLLDLERDCFEVYRRKVSEATKARSLLQQSLAAKEAELATIVSAIGDVDIHSQPKKRASTLREQLAFLMPLLEDMRARKEERIRQFADTKSQIVKITRELSGYADISPVSVEDHDLSLRKLHEYQTHLQSLQKEKLDRLHKVLECVNEVHFLCSLLGLDFGETVCNVHPSVHETENAQSQHISKDTLSDLSQTIEKLKREKDARIKKLKGIVSSLLELWHLMDTTEEEREPFNSITSILRSSSEDVRHPNVLSLETIKQLTEEVERLSKLKATRMKELVLKKRSELEEICQRAHLVPDNSTAPEKSVTLIDSGIVDPLDLLANIEAQIVKAKQDALGRKEIMDKINKWYAACEEAKWLEDYNQDENRYNAGRGVHINLKRAEKARIVVTKIPAMVDDLLNHTCSWEAEKNAQFLYDGVRFASILDEYIIKQQQKDEERRRYRDLKQMQNLLITEKETLYGSKPSPRRTNSFRKTNGIRSNGYATPTPRCFSIGSSTLELQTPQTKSGHQNSYFKEPRRMKATPLNFVSVMKEDTMSVASMCVSESASPPSLCS